MRFAPELFSLVLHELVSSVQELNVRGLYEQVELQAELFFDSLYLNQTNEMNSELELPFLMSWMSSDLKMIYLNSIYVEQLSVEQPSEAPLY